MHRGCAAAMRTLLYTLYAMVCACVEYYHVVVTEDVAMYVASGVVLLALLPCYVAIP